MMKGWTEVEEKRFWVLADTSALQRGIRNLDGFIDTKRRKAVREK